MTQKWKNDRLYYLLNKPVRFASIIFTENTYESLKQTRKEYKHKIARGEVMTPEKPKNFSPEDTPEQIREKLIQTDLDTAQADDGIIETSTWEGYIKNSDGEIEYTRPLVSTRRDLRRSQKITDFISQAEPVRLTPSKAKPAKRAFKLIMAFGDSQIDYREINGVLNPIHDERALSVVQMIAKDLKPETIVNLGDTLDFASLSRFAADSNHFNHSMKPAINRVHRMYAELRADNPDSHIVEVDSNHHKRLGAFVLKNMPQLWGLQRAGQEGEYPTLSYPFLANLDAVGVEWVSGYGAAEYEYGVGYDKPTIVFKHGNTMVSAGSTANKESKENPETHIVRGHGHRMETHTRTTRRGNYLASVMVGCTCSITGDVPSYKSGVSDRGEVVRNQENWQQSVLLIEDYDGEYVFKHVPITKGVAHHNGVTYNGNQN